MYAGTYRVQSRDDYPDYMAVHHGATLMIPVTVAGECRTVPFRPLPRFDTDTCFIALADGCPVVARIGNGRARYAGEMLARSADGVNWEVLHSYAVRGRRCTLSNWNDGESVPVREYRMMSGYDFRADVWYD